MKSTQIYRYAVIGAGAGVLKMRLPALALPSSLWRSLILWALLGNNVPLS